jgi:hypothetical protein
MLFNIYGVMNQERENEIPRMLSTALGWRFDMKEFDVFMMTLISTMGSVRLSTWDVDMNMKWAKRKKFVAGHNDGSCIRVDRSTWSPICAYGSRSRLAE